MKKMKLKKNSKVEIHDDGESNWLISYADLMTLLWGFFVIISAFSTPSTDLMEKLKEQTANSMGGKYVSPFNELTDKLKRILAEINLNQDASVETLTDGVRLTIKSEKFFESGKSSLELGAKSILLKIGVALKDEGDKFNIFVEGHTDDVPIKTLQTPSNWELSSDRASSVVRLFESVGVNRSILRPIGLADTSPLIDISGLSGEELMKARSKNRRIIIKLQKKIPPRIRK